jgi:hypothetical protein
MEMELEEQQVHELEGEVVVRDNLEGENPFERGDEMELEDTFGETANDIAEDEENDESSSEDHGELPLEASVDDSALPNRARKPKSYSGFETNEFDGRAFRLKLGKTRPLKKPKKESTKKILKPKGRATSSKPSSQSVAAQGRIQRNRIPSEKLAQHSNAPVEPVIEIPQPKPIKEKQLNDIEDQLISKCMKSLQREKDIASLQKKLPEGHENLPNLETAFVKGVNQNTSPILNWKSQAAKMIGCLCKVYWDGEGTWFYARVLNYDSKEKRHYVSLILLFLCD